jgi:hypothetical protein
MTDTLSSSPISTSASAATEASSIRPTSSKAEEEEVGVEGEEREEGE